MSKPARTAKKKMPAFTKAPPAVVAVFEAAAAEVPGLERRTMFGYPAMFANGNMAACVFQDRIMVRLDEQERTQALALPGAKLFEPMPGRPMKEYVELPKEIASEWFRKAQAYAQTVKKKKK